MSGNIDRISLALLKDVGIDPSIVQSVTYRHRVGQYPAMRIVVHVPSVDGKITLIDDEPVTETIEFEWKLKGNEVKIVPGSPEWHEWLGTQPRSDEQP